MTSDAVPPSVRILVLKLSDSFAEFWPILARELGIPLVEWSPTAQAAPAPDVAAVVVAAGGQEVALETALPGLALPGDLPVLAVGAATSHRLAAAVVAAGAADYFALPEDRDALRGALTAAVARRLAAFDRSALASLEAQAHAFREIAGESPTLKTALARAARVVPHADATVLITGETGTGKELLARALHYGGPRAAAPFVEVNCAALPAPLLESELFGHERGAFTDARSAKPGLFEVAEGGTLLLDEVDRLAPELQAKLLRALDQKSVRRLGATQSRSVNVRIMAATNADLAAEVAAGAFREDLYYRLNVITLELPPLRERGDDVVILTHHFLRRLCAQYGLPEPALGASARRTLLAHSWPGNVRELRNLIERTLLLSPPGSFEIEPFSSRTAARKPGTLPFPATLADIQRAAAAAMVETVGGNRSEAARRLGISRSRLLRLLRGTDTEETENNA